MRRQPGAVHAGVVLAAGTGTRVGNSRNKAYLPLAGRRIVVWSLELLQRVSGIGRLVLVVRADDVELAAEVLDREYAGMPVDVVLGGATRHDSEFRALLHLADTIRRGEVDIVLIHDAARPLTPLRMAQDVLAAALRTGAAVPGLPVEGVLDVDAAGLLSGPPYDDLVSMQTPQAFRGAPLLAAHEAAARDGFVGTDTAACVERYSDLAVSVVPGHPRNLKVTYAHDLFVAERLLAGERP
ncbi:MAG TPA: IspD/TarI family cytidylyltransferase [Actinomycetes bacterium]|jgi:2-C-methyl-D-erythritol 4-phosphate cytidylyltransferase|nr:IspD/TarI family cytidylyltransferase [Actinomycetes bacterium]